MVPVPGKTEVHLWQIDLSQPPATVERCRGYLSPRETTRADKLHSMQHRNRFIVAHCALRCILAGYLGTEGRKIEFGEGTNGKPRLAGFDPGDLRFNLSHSDDVALLGVAAGLELGVDVERIRYDLAELDMAERFFSPRETAKLRTLQGRQRSRAFFRCWTRKEAYVKASGEGLSHALAKFEVTFAADESPRLLWSQDGDTEMWRLYDVAPGLDYEGALIVAGKSHRLSYWFWPPKNIHP